MPLDFSSVGTYKIEVRITNGECSSNSAAFNVNVTNSAPRFTSVMPDVSAPYGETTTLDLKPYIIDDEANPITVSLKSTFEGAAASIPTGIFSQPTSTSLSIYPPDSSYNGYNYVITVKIEDGQPLFSTTTFNVNIVKSTSNSVPTFSFIPPDFSCAYNSATLSIPLSSYFSDPDGDTLTMSATYSIAASTPLSIPGGIFT